MKLHQADMFIAGLTVVLLAMPQVVRSVSGMEHGAEVATSGAIDPALIERLTGSRATVLPDSVVRVSWPRTDLSVLVDRVSLLPPAGLTAWAAFRPASAGAILMGDTVVLEDEVDAALDAALAAGLEVTGLHNHFFYDQPHVYFMHIGGMASAEELARGVVAVWEAIRGVRRDNPTPATHFDDLLPTVGTMDASSLKTIVEHPATVQDGIVKFTIGRDGMMHGMTVGAAMGLTTWMALSGSDSLAAADGDVIMTANEVQPVLKQLRAANFHVVALHNHMIGEMPAFYFTHFWATGPARGLAAGFKRVLDAQAVVGDVGRQ